MKWRPIDTIPSTLKRARLKEGDREFIGWRDDYGDWHDEGLEDHFDEIEQPTHWLPVLTSIDRTEHV